MNKPITIAVEDFNNEMVDLINESGLPFFVIETVLKNLLHEVHEASNKQLEIDRTKYNEYLKTVKDGV